MKRILRLFFILLCLLISCASADESTLSFPAQIDTIEAEAFAGTSRLSHVVLPEGITSIGKRAFADSSLTDIMFPQSLSSIADDAFENCRITTAHVYKGSYAEAFCIEHNIPYNALNLPLLKSITAICPWAAGGSSDATLRAFTNNSSASTLVDGSITVDNKTGGGGIIGHTALADAEPDGKTIGMITSELSTYSPLGTSDLTYADFDPICRISYEPAAVIVNTAWAEDNSISDLEDFIAYCKEYPDTVQMGTSSNASIWHIAGGYLMNSVGIDIQMITYQEGAATAVQNAASGFIHGVVLSLQEARSFLETGYLTALGVMDSRRSPFFPDVPTCAEAGYDLRFGSFRGIALPKGTDDATRQAIISLCAAAIEDEEFVTFMNNSGYSISYLDSPDFAAFLKQDLENNAKALQTLGL